LPRPAARLCAHFESLDGVRYAAILTLLTASGGGYLYSLAERSQEPAPSVWDGTWWAITTMTTVGYGDEQTTLGRVYALALMLVGIGFIAIVTGAIAERFLATQIDEAVNSAAEIEATEVDVLAELREIRSRLERLETRLGRGVP
jgi:voltage-gated potassium channel